MAALHTALQSLGPSDFSVVPPERADTIEYLQNLFAQAQIIIDSVPPPAEVPCTATSFQANPSRASDLTTSSARSEPIDPNNVSLQKEWSKPIKLGQKENPLGMSVYKLGGKDGRGAWFARRSVHEGLGFRKWKLGLQREFPETMEVQGGPGEGNIRGIGGERRVEKVDIEGVGTIEGMFKAPRSFPGPTTPRDFVTLLVTSSNALESPAASTHPREGHSEPIKAPRHFMVISKPCIHPDCPPRDGFIRGQYESVEFIREIPTKPTKSSSTSDLLHLRHPHTSPLEKAALVESAQRSLDKGGSEQDMLASMDSEGRVPQAKDALIQEGRKRGKTISFAESRGARAKGEAVDTPHDEFDDPAEHNAVEWIMITRSDPGGSVPRFLVDRGTPAGIVSDASKFLDWACQKDHPVKEDYGEKAQEIDQEVERKNSQAPTLEQYQTNGHLIGLGETPSTAESSMTLTNGESANSTTLAPAENAGVMSSLASAAVASIEAYAPQTVIDRLPGHRTENTDSSWLSNNPEPGPSNTNIDDVEGASIASTSDAASFASAEEGMDGASSSSPQSIKSGTKSSPHQSRTDREFAKFQQRKKILDEQLARTREKETKDKEELTSREEERIRKAVEKHAREVSKNQQRYERESAKIEAKRVKEEQKEVDRKKKAEEKDEKVRLTRERDAARTEVEVLKQEKELLRDQVGALQKENTALVARVGKLEMGKKVLGEVKAEIEGGGRSRSSSLRRKKGESADVPGTEGTVLGGNPGV
ncbi:MAG: hypothetical protein Q9174_002579 [Haloplaca sp. 1 TL-2023]